MTPDDLILKGVILKRFGDALKAAAANPFGQNQKSLFPLWRQALHDICHDLHVCPCQTGKRADCVEQWSDAKMIETFRAPNPLSFDNFYTVFSEGRSLALNFLLHARTHDDCTH